MVDATDDLDPSTPVLVGVGTASRPVAGDPDGVDVEALDLMGEAAVAAFDDAGRKGRDGLISRPGWVAVPTGT